LCFTLKWPEKCEASDQWLWRWV